MIQLLKIYSFIISFSVYGQDAATPTLNVTGLARVSVKPDLGILNTEVSEIKQERGMRLRLMEKWVLQKTYSLLILRQML